MFYTDPASHPSLILVEALNLGQVSGRGALDLETLLGEKDSQAAFNWVHFFNNPERWLDWRHVYKHSHHVKLLLPALVNTTNTNRFLFPCRRHHLPPQKLCCKVFTLHSALSYRSTLGILCTLCHLCPSGDTGARVLLSFKTCSLFWGLIVKQLIIKETKVLPDHRLTPTSFHCHTDSTASVCLEASSCSSERERQRETLFQSKELEMIK